MEVGRPVVVMIFPTANHSLMCQTDWEGKGTKKLLKNDLISMSDITAEAIQMRTEHDKHWQCRDARKMNEVTKTVQQVPAGNPFYEEVINILPHIRITLDKLRKNKKKTIMKKREFVGDYLDRVKKIAKDPSSNDLKVGEI